MTARTAALAALEEAARALIEGKSNRDTLQIELEEALARLDAAPADSEGGWRPISEYPADKEGWGPNVLLFVPTGNIAQASDYRLVTGRLEAEMWLGWSTDGSMYDIEGQPTNWMRLPPPPPPARGDRGKG